MAQQPERGVMARAGLLKHQDFVFFVLFVVRIFSRSLARLFLHHKEHRDHQGLSVRVLYGWRSSLKAGLMTRPGPSTHQNFLFFALFVVNKTRSAAVSCLD
jgi:hypothetical protein